MRHKQADAKPVKRRAVQEPLAEGTRKRKPYGFYGCLARMSDEELVAFAQEFMDSNGVKNRLGLSKEYPGLYAVLKRKDGSGKRLIERVVFQKVQRDWASMSDEELVAFAQDYVESNGVKNRSGLQNVDGGLYGTLFRRKLLDAVFSDLESAKADDAVREVVAAVGEFK